jgi:hypothetical protein
VGAWLHPLSEEDGDLEPWNGRLLLNICPEVSLVEQGYACAECRVQFQPDGAHRCVELSVAAPPPPPFTQIITIDK